MSREKGTVKTANIIGRKAELKGTLEVEESTRIDKKVKRQSRTFSPSNSKRKSKGFRFDHSSRSLFQWRMQDGLFSGESRQRVAKTGRTKISLRNGQSKTIDSGRDENYEEHRILWLASSNQAHL